MPKQERDHDELSSEGMSISYSRVRDIPGHHYKQAL